MTPHDDDNESGAFDFERRRWDEEQEILRADPAYHEWLDSLNTKRKETNDGNFSE